MTTPSVWGQQLIIMVKLRISASLFLDIVHFSVEKVHYLR